jgi:protoporphyrinogen oxidase
MRKTDTLILGAGLSGLSAAYHLAGHDFLVVEKKGVPGGLCATEEKQGFLFDQTGHWLHMRDAKMKHLVGELLGLDCVAITRKAYVYSHNTFTRYPFQSNTFGLPPQVIKECVQGFIRAHEKSDRSRAGENFYEWCMANLGEGISRHFMIPYNSKLYTVHPKEFASHWCDTYIPVPTIEQVVEGSRSDPEYDNPGYNATFSYPRSGGIGQLPAALFQACPHERFLFNSCPVAIDMQRRVLRLHNGEEIHFRHIISTIPLRDFLRLVQCGEADRLRAAAQRMKIASVSYYNVAFKTAPSHPGHWFYIPEERYVPYRVGLYSNVYAPLAPAGCSSAYIEYTHQGPLGDESAFRRESIRLLQEMGLISGEDAILFMDYHCIENGYVVFHREYVEDTEMIGQWCCDNGVALAGRYGRWVYSAMEDAVLDGMRAASAVKELSVAVGRA